MLTVLIIGLDISAAEVEAAVNDRLDALKAGVREQTLFVQSVWSAAALGHTLPGMTHPVNDQKYAESISDASALEYPWSGDPFAGRVIALDGARADRYEHGYAAFDMKPGLLHGPNAKPTKDGGMYNVVPFVHAGPGAYTGQKGRALPSEVYALASALHTRQRVKLPGELSGWGMRAKLPVGGMRAAYSWKASPYESMVRVHRDQHTTMLTFRAVSDNSDPDSWWHPGMDPNPVAESVKNYCEPLVIAALERIARGEA